jgi:hypothetical protein
VRAEGARRTGRSRLRSDVCRDVADEVVDDLLFEYGDALILQATVAILRDLLRATSRRLEPGLLLGGALSDHELSIASSTTPVKGQRPKYDVCPRAMSNRNHPSFMPSGKTVIYDKRQKDGPPRRETPRERMARIRARLSERSGDTSAPSDGDQSTAPLGERTP